MTAYDSRARRWDERMRDADQSEGDPKLLPVAQTYTEYADSQYVPHTSKQTLLVEAARLFVDNLPFPPRMRSEFLQFGVTTNDFREALFLLVWQLRETGNLPLTGEREEVTTLVQLIETEMKNRPAVPFSERKRYSVVDTRIRQEPIYSVPLEAPKGQAFQDLLSSNKMDPFAIHGHSRSEMFQKK